MEAQKRQAMQQQLGEQIQEVKQRHKQQIAEGVALAKKQDDDVRKWQASEAEKAALRKNAMLRLKVPLVVSNLQPFSEMVTFSAESSESMLGFFPYEPSIMRCSLQGYY